MSRTRKSRPSQKPVFNGKHAFEHWYRNNQVYFITARCRDKSPAFASEDAKAIFWEKFAQYTALYGFIPFVTSLLINHYHTLGYLKKGDNLGVMMQKLHGSIAKLTNDRLEVRLTPFWYDGKGHKSYFDGCIRDELQCRRTYRYIFTQCRRHGICADPKDYPHTRVNVEIEPAIQRATELEAFLYGVPYKRYDVSG